MKNLIIVVSLLAFTTIAFAAPIDFDNLHVASTTYGIIGGTLRTRLLAAYNDKIYFIVAEDGTANPSKVYCYNPSDGLANSVNHTTLTETTGKFVTLRKIDGLLYFSDDLGNVYSYDGTTLTEMSGTPFTTSDYVSSIEKFNGLTYFATYTGNIFRYDGVAFEQVYDADVSGGGQIRDMVAWQKDGYLYVSFRPFSGCCPPNAYVKRSSSGDADSWETVFQGFWAVNLFLPTADYLYAGVVDTAYSHSSTIRRSSDGTTFPIIYGPDGQYKHPYGSLYYDGIAYFFTNGGSGGFGGIIVDDNGSVSRTINQNWMITQAVELNGEVYALATDSSDALSIAADVYLITTVPEPPEPPCGWIAFVSSQDGDPDIWAVRPDGTDLRQLTDLPGDQYAAQWSPDSTKIAYPSPKDAQIWVYDWLTGGNTKIYDAHDHEGQDLGVSLVGWPSWSPDGTKILFHEDVAHITVINADGTGRRVVPVESGYVAQTSWCPTGTAFVYNRRNSGASYSSDLWIYDFTDTGDIMAGNNIRLTQGASSESTTKYAPDWTPSGNILFMWGHNIAIIDPGQSPNWADPSNPNVTFLTNDGTWPSLVYGYPSWSPDLSQVVYDYWTSQSPEAHLWIMDASGQNGYQLPIPPGSIPDWGNPPPPCWQQQAKLLPSDGAPYDHFGSPLSISGDYAIVGSHSDDDNGTDSGSAYIFKRDGESWIQQAKLTASDGAAGDRFGWSVSMCGDYIIVGARSDDDKGTDSGSIYVFKRTGSSWTEQAKLTAPDGATGDYFGHSVSLSPSTEYAIVGALFDDDNGTDSGSAYIFKRDGESWIQQVKLTASDGDAGDEFGYSLSLDGEYAIVSGYLNDDNGTDSGSAYIFKRNGTSWTEESKLTASDGAAGDSFGNSVSINGDYAIVGSQNDDDNGYNSGSAYIFQHDGGNWLERKKLLPSDGQADDNFGNSVSISADYVIVSAAKDDDNGSNSGSAYIFQRDGQNWVEAEKLLPSDGEAGEYFGSCVSISENYVVMSAHWDDANGTGSGSAYVFKNVCNEAPVANAGDNIQIASAEQALTVIQGTATDPDADPLEYRWLEANQVLLDWSPVDSNGQAYLALGTLPYFSIGNHTLTLKVREVDAGGLSASDEMVLTIENSPPEAQAAPNYQVVEIGIDPIIVVADVADFDGDELSYEWIKDGEVLDSGNIETVHGGNTVPIPDLFVPAGDPCFPVGVHSIELRVSDSINDDVNDFVLVEVSDTCAPSLSPVPSVTILWPPNHKLVPVTIQANAFDNGGGAIDLDVAVQSSEPPDADGDGSTIPDYYIDSVDNQTGLIELRLRAERSGKGDGRTYTITITATDATGNQSVAIVEILAPHDKRKQ